MYPRRPDRINLFVLALVVVAVTGGACASAPPLAPPVVSFDAKMSSIIRLENRRILRDQPAVVMPPPVTKGKRSMVPPPPLPPDLIRLLSDGEARIRRRAAIAVGRVGLTEGVPALVKVLEADADAEVRQMAAFALGLLGDAAAVPPLRAAVAAAAPLVAGRAAEALGLIGDSGSAPAIGAMVATHAAAASALAPDESRADLGESIEAFRLGVYALARLKAYDPLAAALLSPDGEPRVRWWPVAYAFQRIEDARSAPALLALARTDGSYTRAFAIKGLGNLKHAAAVPLLLPLIDPAQAASGPTIEAIRALGRIGDAAGEPALMKLLYTKGLHPMVRAETLLALGDSAAAVSSDAFVDFLGDPTPAVRLAALQGFAKRGDDTFLTVLSGLDSDPHWSVRAGLATILSATDAERALLRLTPMLADSDTRVIPAVLTALTKIKAPGVEKILIERLGSDDVAIRASAAANLGDVKPDGGVDVLLEAYKRGEADVVFDTRAAAIDGLSKYGAPAAAALRQALNDKDWAVRVKAAELLKTIDPAIETAEAMRPAPDAPGTSYDQPALLNPAVSPHLFIETDKGTIEIELDVLDAPLTCANFITLARKGYFDGLSFHRVVPNFVVQGGDPRGDGEGGPGHTIRDELNQEPYLRGTVGMALSWKDTGGSQFFITQSPQPHLDARYTVFGRVVAGMDVVDRLSQGDVMRRVRVWDGVTTD